MIGIRSAGSTPRCSAGDSHLESGGMGLTRSATAAVSKAAMRGFAPPASARLKLIENQLPEEGGPRLAVCASHSLATSGVLAMKSREANVSGMEGRISTTRGGSTRPLASN